MGLRDDGARKELDHRPVVHREGDGGSGHNHLFDPEARELGQVMLAALGSNEEFVSAALPLRVFPPLFNRYDIGMGFKANPFKGLLISGSVLFKLDDGGLRSTVVPLGGISYRF